MRGENGLVGEQPEVFGGSPPHARGKLQDDRGRESRRGITPACAGKTRRRYPLVPLADGSPPHARGKQRRFYGNHAARRITPACAGKTSR